MNRKIILFDFEVFKFDVLLGLRMLDSKSDCCIQTWDKNEIKQIYENNLDAIWVGHNNSGYDNFILQAIINDADPYVVSKSIIEGNRRQWLKLPLIYYDLMQTTYSLKTIEGFMGKNISESKVSFDLDRPLTDEEKLLVEQYNQDDLDQTYDNFIMLQNDFKLKLEIIKEFNLPITCLSFTGTRLAEEVLHAKKIPDIATWLVKPVLYPQLQIKNQEVIDFYLNEKFRTNEKLVVNICGLEHKLGAGGIHAARKKYHCDKALYFDVSGYYNLIMINYNLLPRSIPDKYKDLYKFMYYEQLRLKTIDPGKRGVFKTILLSVFGATMNEYCRFYDPQHGSLITITGQLFLVDLLEKLEGKVEVVQSNTDGIIVRPFDGVEIETITAIVDEWQQRTGFVLKIETIYDIWQRDVNCYMYRDSNGNIHTLGEAVKDYGKWQNPFWKNSFDSKEPLIIPTAIVEYFMNGVTPEETIAKHRDNLRMFQYICKKKSFHWMEYEETDLCTNITTTTTVQSINRAFALKSDKVRGMLFKRKSEGKVTKSRISNLPPSIFVYNQSILDDDVVRELQEKIDYDYYIYRAYERILEFIDDTK